MQHNQQIEGYRPPIWATAFPSELTRGQVAPNRHCQSLDHQGRCESHPFLAPGGEIEMSSGLSESWEQIIPVKTLFLPNVRL
jgi:hypothetical protein